MLRTGLFVGLWVIILSCNSIPETQYTEFRVETNDVVNVRMRLPVTYRETSLEEESEQILNSDQTEEVITQQMEFLTSLAEKTTVLYQDTAHYINSVRILVNPRPTRLPVDAYIRKQTLLYLNEMAQEMSRINKVKYAPLENRQFSLTNGNKIYKIRFRITPTTGQSAGFMMEDEGAGFSYFSTMYLISNDERSVTVIANHQTEDFEYFIRTLSFL